MKKEVTNKQLKHLQDMGYKGGRSLADLIEFLGDDLKRITDTWTIYCVEKTERDDIPRILTEYTEDELIDALCEAAKEKLKEPKPRSNLV